MSPAQLAEDFKALQLKDTVGPRIFTSVYDGGLSSFRDLAEGKVCKVAIDCLDRHYYLDNGSLAKEQISDDGTRKWLVQFGSHKVESRLSS